MVSADRPLFDFLGAAKIGEITADRRGAAPATGRVQSGRARAANPSISLARVDRRAADQLPGKARGAAFSYGKDT